MRVGVYVPLLREYSVLRKLLALVLGKKKHDSVSLLPNVRTVGQGGGRAGEESDLFEKSFGELHKFIKISL